MFKTKKEALDAANLLERTLLEEWDALAALRSKQHNHYGPCSECEEALALWFKPVDELRDYASHLPEEELEVW